MSTLEEVKSLQALNNRILTLTSETVVRVETLEGRMATLEHTVQNEVLLTNRQQWELQQERAKKVRELLPDPVEYKEKSKSLFGELGHDLKKEFTVPSYRDIQRRYFEVAVNYMRTWKPRRNAV